MPKASQSGSKRSRLDENRQRLLKIFEGAPVERAFAGLSAEERLRAAFEISLDIEQFAKKYVPHYLVDQETGAPIDFAAFHRQIFQDLLTVMELAIAAPREHAKSTIVSFLFVLYCICHKLRRFIVLISDTESQAILQLSAVKMELETNDKLRADFGDLVDDRKWGERDFVTATDIRVSGRGAGQSLRGIRYRMRRPDLVICDDLENDEAVESPERREKLKAWVKGTVFSLGKKCQIVFIGTILHFESLLADLLSEDEFKTFTKRFYIAVDDDWNPESLLWPAKWPLEALRAKEQQIGSVVFDQEFRNRPINAATQVFKEEWFQKHAFQWDEVRGLRLLKITGIDPAISERTKADFFGDVTIGIQDDGHILVQRAEQKKMPFAEQLDHVAHNALVEKPAAIGVETVAYQRALKQALEERMRRDRLWIPVLEVEAKGDKFMRISTLAPLVENGTIRFCLEDPGQVNLMKQLMFLGKMKDDVADALQIAVDTARQFRGLTTECVVAQRSVTSEMLAREHARGVSAAGLASGY